MIAIRDYDNKKVTSNAFTSDTTHWKGNVFIKTNKDLNLVTKLYQKHFIMLKDIFIYKSSQTSNCWPHLTCDSILQLCTEINIIDNKNITKDVIFK